MDVTKVYKVLLINNHGLSTFISLKLQTEVVIFTRIGICIKEFIINTFMSLNKITWNLINFFQTFRMFTFTKEEIRD